MKEVCKKTGTVMVLENPAAVRQGRREMEQPGAAASGAGGYSEEPGGGRSTKRSTGNRAANEEETKNKPKLVSAPAAPAGLGDSESPGILLPLNTGAPGAPSQE